MQHFQSTRAPVSAHLASGRIMVLLAAMAALDTMAVDLYSSAFPTLAATFAVSPDAVNASMSIFLLGTAVGQLVLGPLLDRYGRKGPLSAGMALFAIGSLLCAAAPNYPVFLAGRLVQALGASAALVGPRAVVVDIYHSTDVARALSIIMQIVMIAPVISPVLGAFILTHFGWRANFVLLASVAAVHTAVTLWLLPETLPRTHRSASSLNAVARSYKDSLARPDFVWLMLSASCVAGVLYAFLGASPFALIDDFRMSPIGYSLIIGAISLTIILFGAINIRLLPRHGELRLLWPALWLLFGSATVSVLLSFRGLPPLAVYLALLALGVGMIGVLFGNVTALAMGRAGPDAGIASAVLGVAQSLVAASAGLLLAITGTDARGMMIAIGVFALGAILALWQGLKGRLEAVPQS